MLGQQPMNHVNLVGAASLAHLVAAWCGPNAGTWMHTVDVVCSVVGLAWCFSRSTFTYPLWTVGSLVLCLGWAHVAVTQGLAGLPGLITSLFLAWSARRWRNTTFTEVLAEKAGVPVRYGSLLDSFFFAHRPLPAPHNAGCVRPTQQGAVPKAVLLIVNPAAGSGSASVSLARAREVFAKHNIECIVRETRCAGDGHRVAAEYTESIDAVVAVGGDGTLSEVLNGLMSRGDSNLPMFGAIPGGTCNNFCFDLGLTDATKAAEAIASGRFASVDAGRVEHSNGETYSLNTVAWGVGLRAVQIANGLGFLGPLKFDVGGLFAILTIKPTTLTVKFTRDDETVTSTDQYVIAMSQMCQRAGNGFRFGPAAKLDDGLIDTCMLKDISVMRTLELFDEVKRSGSHIFAYDAEYHQWDRMVLGSDVPTPISVDGEDTGMTPISVTCVKNCFRVYM
eukprot:TRINITY_DN20434_c0_g1_i1.p1 TRINITY_DN20434_c0_g1~~TRINITY_DN20434_c0_g1_i1.p1  ORF type:complete len:481 (+),score=151.91 TRINITY_DN20434_c0_g1_i1:99-1445(+)